MSRYEADHIFVSGKFKRRFPAFHVTPYRQGLQAIGADGGAG